MTAQRDLRCSRREPVLKNLGFHLAEITFGRPIVVHVQSIRNTKVLVSWYSATYISWETGVQSLVGPLLMVLK